MVLDKISLDDLKKVIQYIEGNTNQINVSVSIDGQLLVIRSFDRNDKELIIKLYNNSTMFPKVTKTESL